MSWISIVLLVLGVILIGMGLLSRKWKQMAWQKQIALGAILVLVGTYYLIKS